MLTPGSFSSRHLLLVLFCSACVLLATGSGAGAGVLYAPHYNNNAVHVFATHVDGSATELPGSPVGALSSSPDPSGLITFLPSPDATTASAGYLFNGGFQGAALDAAGLPAASSAVSGAEVTTSCVHPVTGRVYMATRTNGMGIRIYDVGAGGVLNEIDQSPATGTRFFTCAITPDGRHFFASDTTSIVRFVIAGDGSLATTGAESVTDVSSLSVTPDGRHLLVLRASEPAKLSSYLIGADGALTFVEGQNLGAFTQGQVLASTDSRFVFVPVTNSERLATFAIAPGGSLTHVGDAPEPSAMRTIVTSADGRQLYGLDGRSGTLVSAPIAADGSIGAFTGIAPLDPSTPTALSMRPLQAPTAAFSVSRTSTAPGQVVELDARATTISLEAVGRYEWDFGDGQTAVAFSPTQAHAYAHSGTYTVTLRAFSGEGCGPERIYTGQFTLCNGGPQAVASAQIKVASPRPVVSRLRVSPKKFKRASKKAKFAFSLSEAARVTLRVERRSTGRKVGGKCRAQSRKNRRSRRCTRWVRTGKSIVRAAKRGSNTVRFGGRIGKRTLSRGNYRVVVTARSSAGMTSARRTASFSVRR